MATLDELTQQVNTLTSTVNQLIANSKKISELTLQSPINTASEIPINGSEKVTIQNIVDKSISSFDLESLTGYTPLEISNAVRKSIEPYYYTSYLPDSTPYTTPSIIASTPTKILIPTTIKGSNGFVVSDLGGSNFAVKYTGLTTETFKIFMSTSMTTSANNVVVELLMYKNGVIEDGIAIARKVGTGSDVGALAVLGEFSATTDDYIEIYTLTDITTTITFDKTSIVITEKN